MFLWIERLINGITNGFGNAANNVADSIWVKMVNWFYDAIFNAVSEFFTLMGNMGADVFDLKWVQALIMLFTLFGWALFIVGVVVAIFDVAIEYQTGRANIKTTAINILKGFFACSLIGILPVELYKFCISLQNTFSRDIANLFGRIGSHPYRKQITGILIIFHQKNSTFDTTTFRIITITIIIIINNESIIIIITILLLLTASSSSTSPSFFFFFIFF